MAFLQVTAGLKLHAPCHALRQQVMGQKQTWEVETKAPRDKKPRSTQRAEAERRSKDVSHSTFSTALSGYSLFLLVVAFLLIAGSFFFWVIFLSLGK